MVFLNCFSVQWLGKTILARLVTEIDEINAMLVRAGSDDVQIGGGAVLFYRVVYMYLFFTLGQSHVCQLAHLQLMLRFNFLIKCNYGRIVHISAGME